MAKKTAKMINGYARVRIDIDFTPEEQAIVLLSINRLNKMLGRPMQVELKRDDLVTFLESSVDVNIQITAEQHQDIEIEDLEEFPDDVKAQFNVVRESEGA